MKPEMESEELFLDWGKDRNLDNAIIDGMMMRPEEDR